MRFNELSAEDQKLLNTDLGDFEKDAAEEMALAQEMYQTGFDKLATETADYLDSVFAKVAEDKEDKEEEKDEEEEKKAADLGAFIERGFFDGLRKLGADRYGDETVYLIPYLEEKVAAAGAAKATGEMFKRLGDSAKKHWGSASGAVSSAANTAKDKVKSVATKGYEGFKGYHTGAAGEFSAGKKRVGDWMKKHPGGPAGKGKKKEQIIKGVKEMGSGAGKLVGPYAGGAALLGGGAYAATRKKQEG